MKITLHRERCVSAGLCVLRVPDVFDQSEDDGAVVLLPGIPAGELEDEILAAARICPTRAIEVADE